MTSRSSHSKAAASIPAFQQPNYFTMIKGSGNWYCNVCSSPVLAKLNSMTIRAALKHETSNAHRQRVRRHESLDPQPDMDAWVHGVDHCKLFDSRVIDQMKHVDQLSEFIPFWQQQVEAAERGVTLRMEDFLDELEKKQLRPGWGPPTFSWAVNPEEDEDRPSETEHSLCRPEQDSRSVGGMADAGDGEAADDIPSDAGSDLDAFLFVEMIARMKSLDIERKRRLHVFYRIPTEKKIEQIRGLIAILRATNH